jgi:hypothetical protein
VNEVLVLVSEDALIPIRTSRCAGARVGGRVVRWIGRRSVDPVVCVDRHHRPVEVVVEHREIEPGDERRHGGVVWIVEVAVTHVVDQDNDVVSLAVVGRIRDVQTALAALALEELGQDCVLAIALRSRAPPFGLDGEHGVVELADQVLNLRVGDRDASPIIDRVSAVVVREREPGERIDHGGVREHEVGGDPDLNVLPDAPQGVVLEIDGAQSVVEPEPDASVAHLRWADWRLALEVLALAEWQGLTVVVVRASVANVVPLDRLAGSSRHDRHEQEEDGNQNRNGPSHGHNLRCVLVLLDGAAHSADGRPREPYHSVHR